MIWSKVFGKFAKGFLVSLAVVILTGIASALTSFVPEGAMQLLLWKALGPILIGAIMAGINWLNHKNDPPVQ